MFDKLLDALKGGAGSGNFNHPGRPGQVGGSMSSFGGVVVDGQPTLGDYITLHKWKNANVNTHGVPVYLSDADLPGTTPGATRLAHGTNLRNISSITANGLKSGKEAGSGEHIDVILGVQGSSSTFGQASIVFDLPNGEWRNINQGWVEIGRAVKPSEIKGIVLHKASVTANELKPIMDEYKQRYGQIVW